MTTPKPKFVSAEAILASEIKKLNSSVNRLASFKFRFLFGIVEGFGGVIGATIIVSLVLFILNQLGQIGFLSPFIQSILNLAGK